jgi:hypothetical protein
MKLTRNKIKANSLEKTSVWQSIFLQSKVNGASYCGEQLLEFNWTWPKDTYLQRRLEYLHKSARDLIVSPSRCAT